MSVTEKYIQLVQLVNESKTSIAHSAREIFLDGFKSGLMACGWDDVGIGHLIMAADRHYLDQGIDRPMCGGQFLDWEPTELHT